MTVGVFGIGSAQGSDSLGWLALEALRDRFAHSAWADRVDWRHCAVPMDMVARWQAYDAIILLDALRPARDPSPVQRVQPGQLAGRECLSSHGLGVREACELAESLGIQVPLYILGLQIDAAVMEPGAWLARYRNELDEVFDALLRTIHDVA